MKPPARSLESIGGLDDDATSALNVMLPSDVLGVMVYGSRARGDHISTSDIDVLALCSSYHGSRSSGSISLSCYTPEQLASASGTLFGQHLARDGRVVFDPEGRLSAIIDRLEPIVPGDVMRRVERLSAVLDVNSQQRMSYLAGLLRAARYLLRTALYVQAIADGAPCFSIRELAARHRMERLEWLLSSHDREKGEGTVDELAEIVDLLDQVVGSLAQNPHGSIQALVVNEWDADQQLAILGTLVISTAESGLDYADLPRIVL